MRGARWPCREGEAAAPKFGHFDSLAAVPRPPSRSSILAADAKVQPVHGTVNNVRLVLCCWLYPDNRHIWPHYSQNSITDDVSSSATLWRIDTIWKLTHPPYFPGVSPRMWFQFNCLLILFNWQTIAVKRNETRAVYKTLAISARCRHILYRHSDWTGSAHVIKLS